jgi:hypothetical protein
MEGASGIAGLLVVVDVADRVTASDRSTASAGMSTPDVGVRSGEVGGGYAAWDSLPGDRHGDRPPKWRVTVLITGSRLPHGPAVGGAG